MFHPDWFGFYPDQPLVEVRIGIGMTWLEYIPMRFYARMCGNEAAGSSSGRERAWASRAGSDCSQK